MFPPPDRQKHDSQASSAGVLSGQVSFTTYPVLDTSYTVHRKRGAPENAPRTMQVTYRVGFGQYKSEWVCIEHEGFARQKAAAWWRKRSNLEFPQSAEEAVDLANEGMLVATRTITVRSVAGEPNERIVDYEIERLPQYLSPTNADEAESVPF